ncbi:MAG: COX15/CtaA family protein [Pseudomonadota bacterium]
MQSSLPRYHPIAYWLIACAVLVWGMVILGGVTRLSGAGLSIVKWQPLIGLLPPMTRAAWQQVFLDYQQFPEFQKVTFDMTLADFKFIYWIEWGHRFLGRLIGVVLLVPTIMCLIKADLRLLWKRFVLVWGLGISQGAMGWYMVKSGLVHDPWVSPYRLTAHLLLAFLILAVLLWTILDLWQPETQAHKQASRSAWWLQVVLLGCIVLTVIFGGLTAGLKAGLIYNTFPDMGGYWLPPEAFALRPWWVNFFENPVLVQATHRFLALISCGVALLWWWSTRHAETSMFRTGLVLAIIGQVILGVSTLLLVVPMILGVVHQAWAAVVLLCGVAILYENKPRVGALSIQPPPSIRLPA